MQQYTSGSPADPPLSPSVIDYLNYETEVQNHGYSDLSADLWVDQEFRIMSQFHHDLSQGTPRNTSYMDNPRRNRPSGSERYFDANHQNSVHTSQHVPHTEQNSADTSPSFIDPRDLNTSPKLDPATVEIAEDWLNSIVNTSIETEAICPRLSPDLIRNNNQATNSDDES
ncbi:hypothetical protein E4U21_006591, partial [Claviceps maximensis]